MQALLLLILSLVFSSTFAQSSSVEDAIKYKINYQLTYKPDSTSLQNTKTETFILYRGNQLSIFASKGRVLKDSLEMNINASNIGSIDFKERATRTKTEFEVVIYKGFPYGKRSYTYKILSDKLRYEEDLNQFSWEILPENKEIKGFNAQKATTTFAGRSYTAWFTSEIPIPDGPYKFNGLPGLILEISDTENHYVYKLKSFEKLKNPVPIVIKAQDFQEGEKTEVLARIREFKLNPFAVVEQNNSIEKTITFGFNDGEKEKILRQYKEKLTKRNNPIELE
jgi:GLPGLI family protein